ncbi:hypothetical protein IGI04_036891, partial [Brassica rapa subsp. trilocularis]
EQRDNVVESSDLFASLLRLTHLLSRISSFCKSPSSLSLNILLHTDTWRSQDNNRDASSLFCDEVTPPPLLCDRSAPLPRLVSLENQSSGVGSGTEAGLTA